MLTLSDPEFHKRIIKKHRVGKRKYIVFPTLVHSRIIRRFITYKSKIHLSVHTLRQMFPCIPHKPIPEAPAWKDNRGHFPKGLFRWIPVATKGMGTMFAPYVTGIPSKETIPSTLKATSFLSTRRFLRPASNTDIQNMEKRPSAGSFKRNSVKNAYFLWNNNLFIPSISLADANRSSQLHPIHEYGPNALDPVHAMKIKEAQNSAIGKNILNSSSTKRRDILEADKELYLFSSSDIEHLIEQKLTEIKKTMVLTKETIMAQSATIYSQIERDLKRQLDMDIISEKVYRQIDHRLKIEYERRGIL